MLEKITKKLEVFKKIKFSTLVILIVLLISNSFAWFLFATKVSTDISAHVTSWNIEFKAGNGEIITHVNCILSEIYPGMPVYTKEVRVHNSGEMNVNLAYEVESYTLLGQTYAIGNTYSANDLKNMLSNNYPFKVQISVDDSGVNDPEDGEGIFLVTVSWPYESGNDALDTQWGEQAYTYYQSHPNSTSLSISIKLMARQ